MKVNIVAYGIARDILKARRSELHLEEDHSLANVKSQLMAKYPEFMKLASLKFAVNEEYQEDTYVLFENDEVVIIPPVSGG